MTYVTVLFLFVAPTEMAVARADEPATGRAAVAGSAFYVDQAGRLLTSRHVVEDCAALSVEPVGGPARPARLIAIGRRDDVALLQELSGGSRPLPLALGAPLDGRPALVIGYPNQGMPRLTPMMVEARLSGPRRGSLFMFEADIRPGDSGAPVLDLAGQVVGMVYGKIDSVAFFRATGRHGDHIGFAVDSGALRVFLAGQGVVAPPPPASLPQSPDSLFDAARPGLVRVLCWR